MKKIISLINPTIPSIFELWYDKPDFVRAELAYLDSPLRKRSDAIVHLMDCKFEKISYTLIFSFMTSCSVTEVYSGIKGAYGYKLPNTDWNILEGILSFSKRIWKISINRMSTRRY